MKRDINLITEEFLFDPFLKLKPKLLTGWLIFLILGFGGFIGEKGMAIKEAKTQMVFSNTHLSGLSKEEQTLNEYIEKNGLTESEASFDEAINWSAILSMIGAIVPEGAWLKDFEGGIKKGENGQPGKKEIQISGFAISHAPITLLLSRLERQSLLSQVHLIYTQKGEMEEDRYIHFEMTGNVN